MRLNYVQELNIPLNLFFHYPIFFLSNFLFFTKQLISNLIYIYIYTRFCSLQSIVNLGFSSDRGGISRSPCLQGPVSLLTHYPASDSNLICNSSCPPLTNVVYFDPLRIVVSLTMCGPDQNQNPFLLFI